MNQITKVKSTEQTIVNFFGIAVSLPDRYNIITMDKNGSVYIHSEDSMVRPLEDSGEWDSQGSKFASYRATYSQYVCNVEYEGDWTQFVMVVE